MPEQELALLHNNLIVAGIMFALGVVGFLARRNIIVMFLCAELMLQGVSLALVGFSRFHNDWGGQLLVIFIIAVAACEAALALALVLMLFRRADNLDITIWQALREEGLPARVDAEIPEDDADLQIWPTLTPAGVEPETDPEEFTYRSHV